VDPRAFSIAPDQAGFDKTKYPGIKTPGYDLLPMILEALAIKKSQRGFPAADHRLGLDRSAVDEGYQRLVSPDVGRE
jgi:hypothetical protein